MRIIKSTNGFDIFVDDQDYEWLSQYSWYAKHDRRANTGYARTRLRGNVHVDVLMHRMVMGVPPSIAIDHANGNGLDNQRGNLRHADDSQNQANRRLPITNKSGYRGVFWNTAHGRWQANIKVRQHQYYLGLFDDRVIAAQAYDAAAKKHFGEFARPNFAEESA